MTGSRISRAGMEAPTPTKILTIDAINARGSTSIGEFLGEIPSFRNSQGPQTSTSTTLGTGQFSPDLRGLGVIRTLTLVDGRRFVPSAATGQVDLNLVPQILINRVDVVTGGASAAYGSDAVSGVVNIILDKKLEGFKADGSIGISSRGDDREQRLSLAFGTGFAGDRGHIMLGGDYVTSDGILATRARDAFALQPGLVSYTGTRAAGLPSRAYLSGVSFINMAYGGLITGANADLNVANGADVLRGIQFGAGGAPSTFNYGNFATYGTASTLASGLTGGNGGLFPQDGFPIVTPVTRQVAFGHIDYNITDTISMFLEGSYGKSGANSASPPVRDTATIGASATTILQNNAYLPASIRQIMVANNISSFTLGRADNDFGTVATNNKNETYRFVGGFSAGLGGGWNLKGYYEYGRNTLTAQVSRLRIEQNFRYAVDAVTVGGQVVCAAAQPNGTVAANGEILHRFNAAASGCVPINLFGAGSPTPSAINYVTGTINYQVLTEQQVGSLTLQGDLFRLPGGPVSVAVGGEYRQEKANAVADAISQASGFNYSNPKSYIGNYAVKEGFGEIVAPILRDAPFAKTLELNGAVRYTDYSTSGGVTTWKAGLIYAPVRDIRFRATRSRDIRAPNNSELFATTSTIAQLRNPFSGVTGQISQFNQPSPSLQPERADTWTAGAVLTPRFIPRFSLSIDYYDINLKGAISSYAPQTILDNCFAETNGGATPFFCTFVNRSGTGSTTVVNSVAVQLLNIASIHERGLDFEASYRFPIKNAQVSLRGIATYVPDLVVDDGTGVAPTFNAAGVIQTLGGKINRAGAVGGFTNGQQTSATDVPHWTATGSATISQGPVTFNIQGRYIGGGKIDPTLVGPGDKYYDPASPISIASNRVGARAYLDLSLQFDVLNQGRRKMQFYIVANNVIDASAPFPVTAIAGQYDRIGRYFRTGVRLAY
ncbi:TonB-dependent receptor [Sphingomonas sp. So64.6b]|uniref:TonB-dependent receptor plug domain-containing protein n=1 Tax=Sphingomonas sp. So64.6b TaxID=2997354 RepID=UPI0016039109|nr:TonB-dependent receptor [Sphingomonas sp. So64.6b]QNA85521.1 TonB-dependent receptor [Sphingomonas sp. So64.6b]